MTKGKGLVLLAIDQDETETAAAAFLAKRDYTWPDFHHGEGQLAKLMGTAPIPRIALIDAQGQIVYDGAGMNEDQLLAQIARLGPEYSDLAQKTNVAPCTAAK